MMTKLWVLMQN